MTEHTNEALIELIRSTTESKDRMDYLAELYQQNYLYIVKICKKYSGHAELDDLMQESFFGLRIAAEKYEADQGTPFINYAAIWIEQAIRRYIEKCGNVIRVPSYMHNSIIKYLTTEKTFIKDHGRQPSDQELCEILSMDVKQLKNVKERIEILYPLSIDRKINTEEGTETYADILPDPVDHYEEIQDRMDADQKRRVVWEEVEHLKDNQAEIIKQYYRDGLLLSSIAESRGVSPEAVRQIKDKGIKNLRKSSRLKQYAEEYLSARAFSGIGLRAFINTNTSATERTAIESYENTIENYAYNTERRMKRMKKSMMQDAIEPVRV